MKHLVAIKFIFLSLNFVFCQSNILCTATLDYKGDDYLIYDENTVASLRDREDIYDFIRELMSTVRLPMGFQVLECEKKSCRNNASASMDKNGTRFITYDDQFFERIKQDSTNIGILIVLAHEIGHHVSGHTLSLNQKNHKASRKFCNPKSENYNKDKCDLLKLDYEIYLRNQRKKELQADSFSGYIMNMYGVELSPIKDFWKSLVPEKDDENSTHPKLSKRLKAVEDGYLLAGKYKNSKVKINIHEIKGNPEINIKYSSKDLHSYEDSEVTKSNNILIQEIEMAIHRAANILQEGSDGALSLGYELSSKYELPQEFIEMEDCWENCCSEKCFIPVFSGISSSVVPRIGFAVNAGIQVKKGVLRILIFRDNGSYFVAYSAVLEKNEISVQEISSVIFEILYDGLQKSIAGYESQQ